MKLNKKKVIIITINDKITGALLVISEPLIFSILIIKTKRQMTEIIIPL